MTTERLAELRADAQKCIEQGEGYHPHVGARDLEKLVDLAEWALVQKKKAADRLAKHRGKEVPAEAKTSQNAHKAPKKPSPAIEAAHTVEEVQAQLAQIQKPKAPAMQAASEMDQPKDHAGYHAAVKEASKPKPKPKPKPAEESALHPAFQSVLFSRVKSPAQLKHDPAATQFKAAKKAKS